MTDEEMKELLDRQTALIEKLSKKKDTWDKFSSLSSFLGTVVIAVIGVYFTATYKKQEVRLAEAQTIEKFLPHLTGANEGEKKGAIISIAALNDPTLAARLGVAYSSGGTIDALEYIYKQAKDEDKKLVEEALLDGHRKRADELVFKGQQADIAISDYNRILELDPKADVYVSRSLAYVLKTNYDLAIRDAQKGISLNPGNCGAYDALGRAYQGMNDPAQAFGNFDKAIECNPAFAGSYADRGWAHLLNNDLYPAINDFESAIRLDPTFVAAYWDLGKVLIRLGRTDDAITNLQKARYLDGVAKTGLSDQIDRDLAGLGAKYVEPTEPQLNHRWS